MIYQTYPPLRISSNPPRLHILDGYGNSQTVYELTPSLCDELCKQLLDSEEVVEEEVEEEVEPVVEEVLEVPEVEEVEPEVPVVRVQEGVLRVEEGVLGVPVVEEEVPEVEEVEPEVPFNRSFADMTKAEIVEEIRELFQVVLDPHDLKADLVAQAEAYRLRGPL